MKILLIEDGPTLAMSLLLLFQEAGHQAQHAANGKEAMAFLDGGLVPDVIICDVLLPDIHGASLLLDLKKRPSLAHTKFCCMTALGGEAFNNVKAALGEIPLLQKPFNMVELAVTLSFGCPCG